MKILYMNQDGRAVLGAVDHEAPARVDHQAREVERRRGLRGTTELEEGLWSRAYGHVPMVTCLWSRAYGHVPMVICVWTCSFSSQVQLLRRCLASVAAQRGRHAP